MVPTNGEGQLNEGERKVKNICPIYLSCLAIQWSAGPFLSTNSCPAHFLTACRILDADEQ